MATLAEAFARATRLHQVGQLSEAADVYRAILAAVPDHAPSLHLLGVIAAQNRRLEPAETLIRRAIALDDGNADFHSNLGAVLREQGRLEEASDCLVLALALAPGQLDARHNLGAVLHDQGRLEQAEDCYRAVIDRQPNHVAALTSLGALLSASGQIDQAEFWLGRALALAPDDSEAHWSLAVTRLLAGNLAGGWAEFDWRWRRPGLVPRRFVEPRWRGQPLAGQTILLHAEQGRGDTIQFARYASLVQARGGRVIVQCQTELVGLLGTLAGVEAVVGNHQTPPPFQWQASLLDLPGAFGTTLETIPAATPYLTAEPSRVARWRQRLSGGGISVGLAWAGTSTHRNDRNRSLTLATLASLLAPLLGLPSVRWFGLQVGPRAADLTAAGLSDRITDLSGEIADFRDTAAMVAALDLVISVDTAVVHLAGALARPAWVLLPFAPDWRWLLGRSDSVWYPGLRLFRQPRPGAWAEVIAEVAQALESAATTGTDDEFKLLRT
ncbi:hypothetical protein WCLP8_3990005 [uncultured Gammaproteobacteria bacterium]